jgi:3-oxoacyl-[acyl-carrier-protein] synthase-3
MSGLPARKSGPAINPTVIKNKERYGNTTAATIPIALDELMEKNMLKSNDTIMFIGLGAGLTWGGVIYKLI